MNNITKSSIDNKIYEENKSNSSWNGLTLEELRYQRALALIKLEAEKSKMGANISSYQTKVEANGLRSVFFQNKLVSQLKVVDYIILGFKASRTIARIWRKFK